MQIRYDFLVAFAVLAGCAGEPRPKPVIALPAEEAGAESASPAPVAKEEGKKSDPGYPEVRAEVKKRFGGVRQCFEELLAHAPNSKGWFTVRWHIEADGSVSDVRLTDSTIGDGDFTRCIVPVFSTMKYTSATGDRSWEFVLSPPK